MDQGTPKRIAYRILTGFDQHYRLFSRINAGAPERFLNADWHGVQRAQKERIRYYSRRVSETVAVLMRQLDSPTISTELWRATKTEYSQLLQGHPQAELAETFFNSVFARLFRHRGLDNQHLYIHTSCARRAPFAPHLLCYRFALRHDPTAAFRKAIGYARLQLKFADLDADLTRLERRLATLLQRIDAHDVEFLKPVFYRNKGAYLIGRLIGRRGESPLILPIRHGEGGLSIDAAITRQDDCSVIFSFTRAYFMVDTDRPAALLRYLRHLMPNKSWAELYSAIGLQKHGKTEFYRDFLSHLNHSSDQFVIAPGIKGMVMSVFTLPSYDVVFKLIKDRFAPPKESNKEEVQQKYNLVKEHDRVGRMADTQEFRNFAFPRHRFSPALLEELLEVAPSEVELDGDRVIIRHLYIERRMTPLNLFLDGAEDLEIHHAIGEYGHAIKQLAAANIFPGDMLFKNFGVTRHGRVVFYDYDEIDYMTDCNFRVIPEPRYPEDEMAAEPWYSIGPKDIFPEEFGRFLLGRPAIRKSFMAQHRDLLDARYWQTLQQQIRDGQYPEIRPYRESCRL
ncbi:bifunctional isocitrate dehydrogenase kinase/phosphatase [Ferrimonas sp. SCSIO 43195]|uniref:bifunctional isocitrate dehydrogenase kinase/phosphatase n=1 Tax=Ferrimonas sp. SCSIO 43195 TaxID=2822844 RepID=UPI0020754A66|nr:bifunctional isocitrate dehydrogenase kinase/phosphatase [Ferrimonas sp. SCSIO 43195]USD38395.1 bifunctional isocitrate dehydrogenase kinase/phosphatase [Ferrimonas sp. SCSIO 43195]